MTHPSSSPLSTSPPDRSPADRFPSNSSPSNSSPAPSSPLPNSTLTSSRLLSPTHLSPPPFSPPPFSPGDFAKAMEATWPPFATFRHGHWLIRQGAGGGKRVSAASVDGDWRDTDLPVVEAAMQDLGQDPLFVIWPWDEALDSMLAAKGYEKLEPVLGYVAPVTAFAPPARMTSFPHWPPMQIARDIWEDGHIGPGRLAVMDRVSGPKTAILGRTANQPSGTAFVALHDQTAMIHALEVRPGLRRQGAGRQILGAAALWAAENGVDRLALAVTVANASARALYASLGMQVVGNYHYRAK